MSGPYRQTIFHGAWLTVDSTHKFGVPKIDAHIMQRPASPGGTVPAPTIAAEVAAVPADPLTLDPRTEHATATALRVYTGAAIASIDLTIIPGPRSLNQMLTVALAWVPSSYGTIRYAADLETIPGRQLYYFGGEPTLHQRFQVPFPVSGSRLLKSPITDERLVLHVFVETVAVTGANVSTVTSGPWFTLDYTMRYDVFGGVL
jgi:hypothetical protein